MLRNSLKLILLTFSFCFLLVANAASTPSISTLFHDASDPVAGNPKGSVTIVEFFDYECSHCMMMAPILETIINNNPDVRIVFKELAIRGSMSEFAARASLAANLQGKYYTFHNELLTTNKDLSKDVILSMAADAGLDVARIKKDMNSSAVTSHLKHNITLAHAFGIQGTPAFFIGKTDAKNRKDVEYILGEATESGLQHAIDKVK